MTTLSFPHPFRFAYQLSVLLLCGCVTISFTANAQVVIPPVNPDLLLTSSASQNEEQNVNADVLQLFNTPHGVAKAFVWDAPQQQTGVLISNLSSNITFVIPYAIRADIAIANDMSNPNNVIVGIIFLNGNKVVFNTYTVNNNTLSYSLTSQEVMNTHPAYGFPHIDMFADDTTGFGFSRMHRFVLSWTEVNDTTGTYYLKSAYGDISTPSIYTAKTILQANDSLYADVAASNYTGANPHLNAYFAIENEENLSLEFQSLNCTNNTLGTLTTLSTQRTLLPRIEAMGLDNPAISINSWAIVAPLWNGTTYEVYVFDNAFMNGQNASLQNFSGWDNRYVAIAAGVGPTYPEPCSSNYYFGWYAHTLSGGAALFVSRGIDYITGYFSDLNSYQINTAPLPFAAPAVPLAMTSFSNTGKALVTVWRWPDTRAFYKLTQSNTGYKPTGITNTKDAHAAIFPNPAHNQLILQIAGKAQYTITNLTGQLLLSGKTNSSKTIIDIHRLSPGMYWLSTQTAKQIQHFKFVKL